CGPREEHPQMSRKHPQIKTLPKTKSILSVCLIRSHPNFQILGCPHMPVRCQRMCANDQILNVVLVERE
ncbi:MAG TPA: hypothetical protein VFT02_04580, partial [Pyrinomonadaceae bacterium]|nr:hypothetical protein [Pyrinomonadaceae bacterium]